jgi:peptide/nickel transport system permease protein
MDDVKTLPGVGPSAAQAEAEAEAEAVAAAPARRRIRFRGGAPTVGAILFALIVALALLAPVIRGGENDINLFAISQGPSWAHPFGTDASGRDQLARVLAAARVDLLIGIVGVLLSFVVGGGIGLLLGYRAGRGSAIFMRGLDALQAFPLLIFALALLAFLGQHVSTIIYAVAFVNVPIFIRLVRTESLSVGQQPFIEAARSVGNPPWRVVSHHLLPNVLTASLTQLTTAVGTAIMLTGGLSFLGVGVQQPTPEWGSLIQVGTQSLSTGRWWLSVFPGLALLITVIALQLIGEGFVRSRRVR